MIQTALTAEQKLQALAYRFYQGAKWEPKPGDYYTSSRADLELYQVVDVRDGKVFTRYLVGSDVIAEWDASEFLAEHTFGRCRVFVPLWVLEASRVDAPVSQKEAVARDTEWLARASVSIADMVDDWYRSLTVKGTASIPPDLVMRRLERFAPAPAGEPAIKALEWTGKTKDPFNDTYWRAATVFDWGYRIYESEGAFRLDSVGYPTLEAAKAAAQADYEARIRSALHPTPTPVSALVGVDAAAVAGWNACRKSVYAVCEDVIDKAIIALERVNEADETAQHEKGFYRGESSVAKSIARGFNAMEAQDDNYLRDALAALRSPAVEGK